MFFMKIVSKSHSSYPRIGDKPEQQKLRRAYHQLDKNKITPDQLEKALSSAIGEIIEEQMRSGCDFVTDGQVRAYDPVSHLAAKIAGFEIGGLLRYFDTNFYYRQPKIKSIPRYSGPIVKEEYAFCQAISGNKATCSILGPYSLLRLSICQVDFEEALMALAGIYSKEIKELSEMGANLIQIEEPLIAQYPQDIELLRGSLEIISKGLQSEVLLGLYFADAVPLLEKLVELPVPGLLFDFTYSRNLFDALKHFPKNIGLGIIDGRNTKMENIEELRAKSDRLLASLDNQTVYITTSCGLEYLPRDRAFDKLKLSADFANTLKGGLR
jgi:5-methyltetrahydropteroyltriglutamate--homocysteine methyltransferase